MPLVAQDAGRTSSRRSLLVGPVKESANRSSLQEFDALVGHPHENIFWLALFTVVVLLATTGLILHSSTHRIKEHRRKLVLSTILIVKSSRNEALAA